MLRILAIPVMLIALLMSACQTNMVKQFDQVKPGMEKDDVLQLMGSPNRTQRFHGKDRWTYILYENYMRFEKEVHFFEGNAVYVGNTWHPDPEQSAFVVDKKNEEKNQKMDQELSAEITLHRKAFEQYEAQSKGADKVRYVPTFEPIR